MEIKLGDQTKEVKFGLQMIDELDKVYVIKTGGAEFAMGLNLAFNYLQSRNPSAISNVLKACFPHVAKEKINTYVEGFAAEHGTLEPLFEQLLDEMGKHPLLTATLNNFKKTARVTEED